MKNPMTKLIIMCVAIVILVVFTSTVFKSIDNKEIENRDYYWLQYFGTDCYPDAKADIKEALENDNKIRRLEYYAIVRKCSEHRERKNADAKDHLTEFLE